MANENIRDSEKLLKNARSTVEAQRELVELGKKYGFEIRNISGNVEKIHKATSKTGTVVSKQLQKSQEDLRTVEDKLGKLKVINSLEKAGLKTKKQVRDQIIKSFPLETAHYKELINLNKKDRDITKTKLEEQARLTKLRIREEKKIVSAKVSQERASAKRRDQELKKEVQKRKWFEKKFGWGGEREVVEKQETLKKGKGRAYGKIAGDVDEAVSSVFKPFQNKSLNPLKWLKGGSDAADEMEKSSNKMATWAMALDRTVAGRNMAAGRAIKGGDKKNIKEGVDSTLGKVLKDTGKDRVKGKSKKDIKKGIDATLGDAAKEPDVGKDKKVKSTIHSRIRDMFGAAFGPEAVTGKLKKSVLAKHAGGGGIGDLGAFTKATKGLNMMLTVVRALSLALGVLSKMSWIFAIIGAISSLVSAGIELDKFLKGLNKTFFEMAGPTVGLKDIKKDMGDFNDAIFDLNRNIKLGLKAEDIQGMFKAVAGVGLPAKAFAGLAGGYDNAIKMVRKTNIDLGISFEEAGKVISEQMMDLTTTFDISRKSLQSLGFEATKAGVTSGKFYAAIQNSVSALSFLGNYTKQASGALTMFMKDSSLSFKDAAEAANEYMGVFHKMDWKQLQVTFGMAGKGLVEIMRSEATKMWGDPLKKNEEKLKDLTKQLEEAEKAGDAAKQAELNTSINNLNKEIKSNTVRLRGFDEAVADYEKSGAVGELQQYRDLLTTNLAQVMGQIEDNTDPKNYTTKFVALQKGLNIAPELLRAVEDAKKTISASYSGVEKVFEDKLGKAIGGNEQQIEYTKSLVEYGKKNSSSPEKLEDLKKAFRDQGKSMNMNADESRDYAQNMIDMISSGDMSSDDITHALDALKKGNDKNAIKEATKFLNPDKKRLRQLVDGSTLSRKANEEGYDTLNDNELDMIKSMTSSADYMDIAKDSLKYMAAKDTAGIMSQMLKGVMSIGSDVGLLASDKKSKYEKKKTELSKMVIGGDEQGLGGTTVGEIGAKKLKDEAELVKLEKRQKEGTEVLKPEEKQRIEDLKKSIEDSNNILSAVKTVMVNLLGMNDADSDRAKAELARETEAKQNQEAIDKIQSDNKSTERKSDLPQAPTTISAPVLPAKQDFKATKAGLALLDKGDMAFNPAMGIAGKSGAFVNEVLSKMGLFDAPMTKGAGGGENASYQINLGGIKVYGDIQDPVVVRQAGEKLTMMVKQIIAKHEREKMLAKV